MSVNASGIRIRSIIATPTPRKVWFSSPLSQCGVFIAGQFDLDQSANDGSARMKYISDRSALERAAAMIRTISPNRAGFGRCSACAVRSLSICGALDQSDVAEFERIVR